jgi:hypothetical protein
MSERTSSRPHLIALLAAVAAASGACSEKNDFGPHDIRGWIDECEERCHQQKSCDYDQFLFDHGNIASCTGDCSYFLDVEEDVQLVEETGGACVEALYAEVRCVFGLGCDALARWEDQAADAPCAAEAVATDGACSGVDIDVLLEDCGWPQNAAL